MIVKEKNNKNVKLITICRTPNILSLTDVYLLDNAFMFFVETVVKNIYNYLTKYMKKVIQNRLSYQYFCK